MTDGETKKSKRDVAFDEARFTSLKEKADAKTLTPTEKLEYRRLTLARRELSLSKQKTSLRLQERKADANRKIKLGGLVMASGLGDWDEATLRGAFAYLARTSDAQILKGWRDAGGAQYDTEIKNRKTTTVKLAVSFAAQPSEHVRAGLRAKGLTWRPERRRWEGTGMLSEIAALAGEAGGQVEELAD